MRGGLILNNTFEIYFSDKSKITFSDIIDFEEDQKREIKNIALRFTKTELKMIQTGIPLQNELTIDQKNVVVDLKKQVVNAKTAKQLIALKLVKVLPHALKQLFQRTPDGVAHNNEYLVNKLIHTDQVKKALFKGYAQLSYTMYSLSDPEEFEIPISFIVKRKHTEVLIITVYFADAIDTHTVNTIGEGDENKRKLLAFYKANFEKF